MLNPSDLALRLTEAGRFLREAGALALEMQAAAAAAPHITWKGERDFVTVADHAVEALLIERLSAFGDNVFGEESGGLRADRLWVVDPIDGTYNYAHRLPHWCISAAFVASGALELGLVYDPNRNELFAARRSYGATLNGQPIRVGGALDTNRPLIEVGASKRLPFIDSLSLVQRFVAAGYEFRRLGSGALAMAWVAAGRTSGFCELHINSWDVLAGLLLVREAGGWTSEFVSGNWLEEGNPIIGCIPALRERLIALSGIRAAP